MNRVECPGCGYVLKFADEHAGKKARCSKCGFAFRLPQFVEAGPARHPSTSTPRPVAEAARHGEPIAGKIIGRAQSVLMSIIAIYFLAGVVLGNAAVRETVRGEDQGDAVAVDAGNTLSSVYNIVWEPANRPVRSFLPQGGRYALFQMDNRYWYLDVAPLIAGALASALVVLGFNLLRRAFLIPEPAV